MKKILNLIIILYLIGGFLHIKSDTNIISVFKETSISKYSTYELDYSSYHITTNNFIEEFKFFENKSHEILSIAPHDQKYIKKYPMPKYLKQGIKSFTYKFFDVYDKANEEEYNNIMIKGIPIKNVIIICSEEDLLEYIKNKKIAYKLL